MVTVNRRLLWTRNNCHQHDTSKDRFEGVASGKLQAEWVLGLQSRVRDCKYDDVVRGR